MLKYTVFSIFFPCEALTNSEGMKVVISTFGEKEFFVGEGGRKGSQGPSEGVKELANDLGRRIVWIKP